MAAVNCMYWHTIRNVFLDAALWLTCVKVGQSSCLLVRQTTKCALHATCTVHCMQSINCATDDLCYWLMAKDVFSVLIKFNSQWLSGWKWQHQERWNLYLMKELLLQFVAWFKRKKEFRFGLDLYAWLHTLVWVRMVANVRPYGC
jgi:hypothetical protein